jgi:type IX secretion system PorP/SprF family membrane protein
MKNLVLSIILILTSGVLLAQQEAHNTQFMYYKQGYNPGVVGSKELPCITGIYRHQWLGFEGAPQSQILTVGVPLANQRIGLGANIYRHTIGITENVTADLLYAYRIRMGRGYLGLGLQGSVRSLKVNFSDQRLVSTQPLMDDPAIPNNQQQKFLFNVGAGAYYEGENFYLGVSLPRMLENNIDFADSDAVLSKEFQHLYIMGGVSLPLGDDLSLQPQMLIKYVDNAPFDADVNLSLNIVNKYVVGVTYRLGGSTISGVGESIDLLLAAQLSDNLLLGVSYDYTLSDLRTYNSGSLEVVLRYCIGEASGVEYVNPRFF